MSEQTTVRVYKRRRRPGPRRGVNLMLTPDHAIRLELIAVRQLTTVSEVVMDWIEEAGRRGRKGESAASDGDPAGDLAA